MSGTRTSRPESIDGEPATELSLRPFGETSGFASPSRDGFALNGQLISLFRLASTALRSGRANLDDRPAAIPSRRLWVAPAKDTRQRGDQLVAHGRAGVASGAVRHETLRSIEGERRRNRWISG